MKAVVLWVLLVVSLLSAIAQILKAFELGTWSVRGRLYLMVFLAFLFQAAYAVSQAEVVLILSRVLIAYSVLQYISPFVKSGFKSISPAGWFVWGTLSVLTSVIPPLSVGFYSSLNLWRILILIVDIITTVGGAWATTAFWGSEVGNRWVFGFVVIVLMITGDTLVLVGSQVGYLVLTVMTLIMGLIALRRG